MPDQAGKEFEFMDALASITTIESTPVVIVATATVSTATIAAAFLAVAVGGTYALPLIALTTAAHLSIW